MKKRIYDFLFTLLECAVAVLANALGWINRRLA